QRNAQTAVASADALDDRVSRALSRSALAYFHLQRGEWHPAAALFNQIRDLLAESDNRLVHIIIRAQAAEVALGRGRLDDAAQMVVEALELARDASSRHCEALALRVQGQILATRESGEMASRAFDDAIAIFEELGSRLELGRALYHRGQFRRTFGQTDEAQADP